MVLPWEQLRLVLALARHGTLAGAGRALGMSPAALEAELKRVERAAGAALFVREEGRLLPTDAGRSAMHTGERLAEEMARRRPGPPPRVTPGSPCCSASRRPSPRSGFRRPPRTSPGSWRTSPWSSSRPGAGARDRFAGDRHPAGAGEGGITPGAGDARRGTLRVRATSSTTADLRVRTRSSGIGWSCSPGRRRVPPRAAGWLARFAGAPGWPSGPTACRCSSPRSTRGWAWASCPVARRSSRPSWSGSRSCRSCHPGRSGSPSGARGSRPRG